MRLCLIAVAALLPASLAAQFPAVGTYKGYAQPVGADNKIDLLLRVEKAVDSTVIKLLQDPEQPPIPLTSQEALSSGFSIAFGNLSCPLVVVGEEWEAVCADQLGNPTFSLRFSRKAEPPAPPPPPTAG